MKLNVTHSASPCAASVRRTNSARCCRGVSVGSGTGAARGNDTGGTASSPRSRSTSSIRSHSGSISAQPSRGFRRHRRIEVRCLVQHHRRGDVVAPGRHRDRHLVRIALPHREAEALQRLHCLIRAEYPTRRTRPCARTAAWRRVARPVARRPRSTSPGSPPHSSRIIARRRFHRIRHQRRIDAALEALARVGDHLVPPPGQRHTHRIEQRAFDEHGGGGLVAAGRLAADHAGHRLHAGGIGNGAILRRRPCSPCRSAHGTFRLHRAAASAHRRPACPRRTRAAAGRDRR